MEKEKCIETLNEIKDYVQEEWDPFEYEDEIKKAVEAVDMAVGIIESSNVCSEWGNIYYFQGIKIRTVNSVG